MITLNAVALSASKPSLADEARARLTPKRHVFIRHCAQFVSFLTDLKISKKKPVKPAFCHISKGNLRFTSHPFAP
jgi:hypothetical protein